MNIWYNRNISLRWLTDRLSLDSDMVITGFSLLDDSISRLMENSDRLGDSMLGQFARVSAITATKAKRFLLACYSLVLDGLAQEAGAVLRPLIETIEMMTYFHQDPTRTINIWNHELPTAGEIAKAINGEFKPLRQYLNDNASHFGLRYDSIRHLLKPSTLEINLIPRIDMAQLHINTGLLNAFQVFAMSESLSCLNTCGDQSQELSQKAEVWRQKSIEVFKELGKEH